jgi:hypothetical protein
VRAAVLLTMMVILSACRSSYYSANSQRVCEIEHARTIGRLYYIANPIQEQTDLLPLETFVSENREFFSPSGAFTTCAANVAYRMMRQANLTFSPEDADRAYEDSLNAGAIPEQARRAADSINAGSVDTRTIGQELLWLARVIPNAAAGDWNPYRKTGTELRLQIRQVWPLYNQPNGLELVSHTTIQEAQQQFQPWLEYQIAYLVFFLGA